jgi:UDP-N-acetylglucosamine 2-epimerase (non-hydrolysing)
MTKLKVTTILGTRPEIIRMSEIVRKFDKYFTHRLVHTGQNTGTSLNEVFFQDLELRKPDLVLEAKHQTLGNFLGNLMIEIEKELLANRPDAVVILGDTNSALSSIIAKRFRIPIYHLEAGNRSFDLNVPEEINRKIVDHTSDYNLVYTEHARRNLLAEGLHPRNISLIGSPLYEVLNRWNDKIKKSNILTALRLTKGEYFLVSIHRQENVDFPDRLNLLISSLELLAQKFQIPVVVSTHPRTRDKIIVLKGALPDGLMFHEPFGFIDYNNLQINSRLVLSDSGTISEESAMLNFPAITIRDSMERPEALELGTIVMSGISPSQILEAIQIVELQGLGSICPPEYQVGDTSTRVVNYIVSTVHQHAFWNGLHTRQS